MSAFDLNTYATVQERIAQFYMDLPKGSIRTFMIKAEGPEVVFEARVYRTPEEAEKGIYTSGWARELEGKSPVNRTSHLENCESSALGRALANLGYSTSKERPSREEMILANRQRLEHEAYLVFIRAVYDALDPEVQCPIHPDRPEQMVSLRAHLLAMGTAAKNQPTVARYLVDLIEAHTPHRIQGTSVSQAA